MFRHAAVLLLVLASAPSLASEWRQVRPSNTGIPGEEIRFVRFAPDGTPWVGARWPFWQEGGVGIYDRAARVWTTHANFETAIPSEYVNDIVFGPGGAVWIATDEGLVKKVGESWTVYTTANSPLLHNRIRNIALAPNGHLWINNTDVTHQNAALFEFDGAQTWRSFAVPQIPWEDPWRQLTDVYVGANGHVWVTNMSLPGVAEYDGQTWRLHGGNVGVFGSITGDLAGNIWLITGNLGYEVYRFDGTSFILFGGGTPPLSNTTITRVAVDRTGAVFIGNWVGQVVKSTNGGATWSSFSVVSARVTDIAPDPSGDEVWVGSAGAVHRHDASGTRLEVFNTYNTGMPWYWVDNWYADPQGNLWVATGEAGASRFDGARWRNWGAHNAGSEPWPFLAEQAFGLYQDRLGFMWIGSNGVGRLNLVTGELRIWDWRNTPIFGVTMFRYFAEDMNGTLFAMTDYGTTFRLDRETDTWTRETVQPYAPLGLPGVATDSQGNVWIAGWFALHKWDGQSWTTVGQDWPLFDLGGVNAIAIGPDDTIWLGTNQGLVHWDGANLAIHDPSNSPLPGSLVGSIAFRSDGLMALTFVTEYAWDRSGVATIRGDAADPASWTVYRASENPISHWPQAAAAPGYAIGPAAPNPFRGSTTIRFGVPEGTGRAELAIYDVSGRLVRHLAGGDGGAAIWDGKDDAARAMPSGVYVARLRARGYDGSTRLVLLK